MAERWVTLLTAPDQLTAEMWQCLLHEEGIPSRLEAGRNISFLGPSPFPCRLLVPESVLKEAQAALERYQNQEEEPGASS